MTSPDAVKVEVRLTTLQRLDEALSLPCDAVGLGQEGCVAKLPGTAALRVAADRVRDAGREVVVVAPVAWPGNADALLAHVRAVVADGPATIAVNDIGTLLALAGDGNPHARFVAGFGLTRGRPHSSDPRNAEPPQPQLDTALLRVLERHGVDGVEVDCDTITDDFDDVWQLRQLSGVTPVGYARSCPTARHHRTGPPDCMSCCDTPFEIAANSRWQLGHGHREPLPAGTRPRAMTVWGNAVYQPATVRPTAGYRIVEARWHTREQLADTVGELRDQPFTRITEGAARL